MKATSIATGVVYTPLIGKIEGQWPPHNNDNYLDHWHVTMQDPSDCCASESHCGAFKTEEEAKGFMAGWNAHRGRVSGLLFRKKLG
jgi:hypothetical protein